MNFEQFVQRGMKAQAAVNDVLKNLPAASSSAGNSDRGQAAERTNAAPRPLTAKRKGRVK